MKVFLYATILTFIGSCATKSYKEKISDIRNSITIVEPVQAEAYASTITAKELSSHLYIFSSDAYEGRATGTKGQKLAANFLKQYYLSEGIASPLGNDNYYQTISQGYFSNNYRDSENVVAYVEGSEKSNEVIIISAHYDHEGVNEQGEIFNGADDDGSGTVALMEMAQAFKMAKDNGHGPKRSILFLHTTAEEVGLYGSRYYTENPIFPLKQTVANLNIDMIGRVDKTHENEQNSNYVYLIGSNRLSTELHFISEAVNNQFTGLELDYKYNDRNDRNRYYYRSDHYNFAKHDIPVIFYFNGEHEDYHRPTDTADKINYDLLEKRTKLIFTTAWQLANQEKRIQLDN